MREISGNALAYAEDFSSVVASAQGGKPAGNEAWGALMLRAQLMEVERQLERLTARGGAGLARRYLVLGVEIYIASTNDLVAAASPNRGTMAAVLESQALRLEQLGDRVFDRGRELIAVIDGAAIPLARAIPNFVKRKEGPAGSALSPSPEMVAQPSTWRHFMDDVTTRIETWMKRSNRNALDRMVNEMAVIFPGQGCLTDVARAMRESVALAGEAALDGNVANFRTVVSLRYDLWKLAVDLWNVSASASGVVPLRLSGIS